MSAQDLALLAQRAQEDSGLMERLRRADSVSTVIEIAAELSLTVTPADFDPSELTEADLSEVSGGVAGPSNLLMRPTSDLWLWCR